MIDKNTGHLKMEFSKKESLGPVSIDSWEDDLNRFGFLKVRQGSDLCFGPGFMREVDNTAE